MKKAVLVATLILLVFTTPVLADHKGPVEGEPATVVLEVWSPKKVSANPFGTSSLNKESAAGHYNVAILEGIITKFLGREVGSAENVTEADIEILIVPAGTIVEGMAGCKGKKGDCEVIYRGPFRLVEPTTVYVTRKWGRPVGLISACSNPWIGVIPEPLRGLPGHDGAPGGIGPQGPAGATGPAGNPGLSGGNGRDGKCRIIGIPCAPVIVSVVLASVGAVLCATHTGICKENNLRVTQTPQCRSGDCVVRPVNFSFNIIFGARF